MTIQEARTILTSIPFELWWIALSLPTILALIGLLSLIFGPFEGAMTKGANGDIGGTFPVDCNMSGSCDAGGNCDASSCS